MIALAGLTLSACSGDDSATDDEPTTTAASGKLNEALAEEVVAHYAEGVFASYTATLDGAKALDAAVEAFVADRSQTVGVPA